MRINRRLQVLGANNINLSPLAIKKECCYGKYKLFIALISNNKKIKVCSCKGTKTVLTPPAMGRYLCMHGEGWWWWWWWVAKFRTHCDRCHTHWSVYVAVLHMRLSVLGIRGM